MAIYRPKTIGDAPEGLERSGGCCRRDFLASRGMGVSPGEESRVDSVAAQTIEAQPIFGQIEPSRGHVRRVLNRKSGRRWRVSVQSGKRSERFGVGKETKGGKRRYWQRGDIPNEQLWRRIFVHRTQSLPSHRSVTRKVAAIFRSSSLTHVRRAAVANKFREADSAGSLLMRGGYENRSRIAPDCPSASSGRRSVKIVNRVHAVPPTKTALMQAKISRHTNDGTPICDIANTT